MVGDKANISEEMGIPAARLTLAITGHRDSHPTFNANSETIRTTLANIFATIESQTSGAGTTRIHSLLAQGADIMAVELALEKGWEVSAPLPFGRALNIAINAHPETAADARALLAGERAADPEVQSRAMHIDQLANRANVFALAEQDEAIANAYLESLAAADNLDMNNAFAALASKRASSAARVMIEHSAILIAIWDGSTLGSTGGTRHTMALALEHGTPVIWINAAAPENWCLLTTSEALANQHSQDHADREMALKTLVESVLLDPASEPGGDGMMDLIKEKWRPRSNRFYHSYRRVEALFGGTAKGSRFGSLVQHYEAPDAIAEGSAKPLLTAMHALPDADPQLATTISQRIVRRFAWVDGLSTHLSDAYRGSMINNFLLSTMAIVGGIAYLPLGKFAIKWPFALFEFVILLLILLATAIGRQRRWHSRWFETRRVAEYLRHMPILLLLGAARAPWRWPVGANTSWPEHYARNMVQDIGLPRVTITTEYLSALLENILLTHVVGQRDYHRAKAKRLTKTHHNLDRISEICFILAVISVGSFLLLASLAALGVVPDYAVYAVSKPFTFFGVLFPSLGGLFAGIRFFGDFERFAAISEVTAEKLDTVEQRIAILLNARLEALQYEQVADLAHVVDDIVIDEIENWQAVFGGKQISVPV